jgi:hypothetical protein
VNAARHLHQLSANESMPDRSIPLVSGRSAVPSSLTQREDGTLDGSSPMILPSLSVGGGSQIPEISHSGDRTGTASGTVDLLTITKPGLYSLSVMRRGGSAGAAALIIQRGGSTYLRNIGGSITLSLSGATVQFTAPATDTYEYHCAKLR